MRDLSTPGSLQFISPIMRNKEKKKKSKTNKKTRQTRKNLEEQKKL